jgi:hypothetical protein
MANKVSLSKQAQGQLAGRGTTEADIWKILAENKPYIVEDDLTIYHG